MTPSTPPASWRERLAQMLPLLGHRNWIVLTDMAYPLQSASGITTLWADAEPAEALGHVARLLADAPHVFAHVHLDREQQALTEDLAPGIEAYRADLGRALAADPRMVADYTPHEELIARLDAAARLFSIVIVKTRLTLPFTSVFFELDCRYWDAACQARLEERL